VCGTKAGASCVRPEGPVSGGSLKRACQRQTTTLALEIEHRLIVCFACFEVLSGGGRGFSKPPNRSVGTKGLLLANPRRARKSPLLANPRLRGKAHNDGVRHSGHFSKPQIAGVRRTTKFRTPKTRRIVATPRRRPPPVGCPALPQRRPLVRVSLG
jgi:hypothetical protein